MQLQKVDAPPPPTPPSKAHAKHLRLPKGTSFIIVHGTTPPPWSSLQSVPWGMGTPTYRLNLYAKTKLTTSTQHAVAEHGRGLMCEPLSPDLLSPGLGLGEACGRTSQHTLEAKPSPTSPHAHT
jgi:hypothetical protein